MMDDSVVCFPNNVSALVAYKFEGIDPDIRVHQRPVRETDDTFTIAVVPMNWEPIESSKEMVGRRFEPSLQRYNFMVQGLIIDGDEERGIARHSQLSAKIRHTLYRDEALRLTLPQLRVAFPGSTSAAEEKVSRWDIGSQEFLNQKLPGTGTFVFLSNTFFWVETELK